LVLGNIAVDGGQPQLTPGPKSAWRKFHRIGTGKRPCHHLLTDCRQLFHNRIEEELPVFRSRLHIELSLCSIFRYFWAVRWGPDSAPRPSVRRRFGAS